MSILLWTLTIIFSIISIKSSNENVINSLKNTRIEKYLYQFSNGNDFFWDISIGFLISVIFYVIVVYIPERRKKMDIEPFINNKSELIIWGSYSMINEIIQKSNLKYDFKNLTQTQFDEICRKVNPKAHSYKFANQITNTFENHLGFKIYNSWARIINDIDETIRLLPNIDSGLLKRIYALYNNFLRYTAKDLKEFEKLKNEDLSSWSSTIFSFYIETKELRDYYVLYSKSEFKNDPWKQ